MFLFNRFHKWIKTNNSKYTSPAVMLIAIILALQTHVAVAGATAEADAIPANSSASDSVPAPKAETDTQPTPPASVNPTMSESSTDTGKASASTAPVASTAASTVPVPIKHDEPKAENASIPASAPADNVMSPDAERPATEASAASPSVTELPFTSSQEQRIGEIAKEYLIAHPEVLLEVSEKLQAQQRELQMKSMTAAVLVHQDGLLNDLSSPVYGPADAKVAVIEFFDYQCSSCLRQAAVMTELIKANPQVRYVFKEWPVLGARWPASMDAAERGQLIWQQKGADAYLAYHNAIFAMGRNEGKLTQQDINLASAKAGKLKGKAGDTLGDLAQTDVLAQNLGIHGAHGLIVMPVAGATSDNITVILGVAGADTLQTAIAKAAGQ